MKNLILILAFIFAFVTSTTGYTQISSVAEQIIDKNYVVNGGFENSKAGWVAYKNTAQATPVTGLGGTPAVTITASTSAPIAGKSSGILTKGATNLQGEGISIPFVIDSAAKGRVLTISGLYQIISGTYSGGTSQTDSDVEAYIYDVDAAQIIQPAGYKLDGGVSGINYPIAATFQTNLTSSNYRLILHVATVSASAYSLKLDSIKVGVGNKSQGPPVTDFTSNLIFSSGISTNATFTYKSRRVGDSLNGVVQWTFTGANTQASQTINLPINIDTTKVPTNGRTVYGQWHMRNPASGTAYSGAVIAGLAVTGASNLILEGVVPSSSTPFAISANTELSAEFTYPVQGWGSTVTMSDSADSRVVAAQIAFNNNGDQIFPATTQTTLKFGTVLSDTHGAFNSATYTYTVPVSGYYRISAMIRMFTSYAQDQQLGFIAGGVNYTVDIISANTISYLKGSQTVKLNAGQTIYVVEYNAAAGTTQAQSGLGVLSIEKISGPSQIAASESVNSFYAISNSQAFANNTIVNLNWNFKGYDSHGTTVVGNTFTAPVSGVYEITAQIGFATLPLGIDYTFQLQMNGPGSDGRVTEFTAKSATAFQGYPTIVATHSFKLKAGDPVTMTIYNFNNSATTLSAMNGRTHLYIKRIGN